MLLYRALLRRLDRDAAFALAGDVLHEAALAFLDETVRLTRTCALIGWGSRGSAVIEGSGWEPALAFAGLGMSERGTGDTMGWSIGDTGERSVACNLSIRSRNRAQAFAVSVVNGAPKFVRCDLRDGQHDFPIRELFVFDLRSVG